MSTTVFKGAIKTGTIRAKVFADFSNSGSDLLVLGYAADGGGGAQSSQAVAAPGGSARAELTAPAKGVLEVWVVVGDAKDSGRLQVMHGDTVVDDGTFQDAVRWVYAVEA